MMGHQQVEQAALFCYASGEGPSRRLSGRLIALKQRERRFGLPIPGQQLVDALGGVIR